jgi:hypothetical protein
MNEKDFKIFEQFVKMSQPALKKVMSRWLKEHYTKVVETKDYIYAEGDIPIALAAHMDTVFSKPVEDLFYDTRKNAMWSPEGLGADDRAGVFAIYNILRSGLRPHVLLSTDEEKGCLGAAELSKLPCPFEKLNYIIQLDRRGTNDCVFYDCDNPEFVKYVEEFGFVEAIGSFTDITHYCPAWGVAGVNLSVGYMNEHSYSEILYVNVLYATIEKVKKMLKVEEIPYFEYIPYVYAYDGKYWGAGWGNSYGSNWNVGSSTPGAKYTYRIVPCAKCGEKEFDEDMFPVLGLDGTEKLYCPECIAGNDIEWCEKCFKPVEKDPTTKHVGRKYVCPKCQVTGGKTNGV